MGTKTRVADPSQPDLAVKALRRAMQSYFGASFSAWLKTEMMIRQLNGKGLAAASNGLIDAATISRWKSGLTLPNVASIVALAHALNLDPHTVFDAVAADRVVS